VQSQDEAENRRTAVIAIPNPKLMTPAEYLEWEAQQENRHEYLNGEVYAMTGGTLAHNDIALNLYSSLRAHIRARGCRMNAIDAKTQITEQGPFFYPDLLISCDPRDKAAVKFVQFPCLIAEVLSPGTESYDRGEKFAHYRRLESLQEYLLISSTKPSVEIFRLNERHKWELTPYEAGETMQLTSIDFECAIELLYEDVDLSQRL
jgi:Uma2 family endonuclease